MVKSNINKAFKHTIDELATKFDTAELPNNEGKPICSGWYVKSIDSFSVDIYQATIARGSSYSESPAKI